MAASSPIDHQPHQFIFTAFCGQHCADQPAIAEHSHALRDAEHLTQPVRDIDDADTLRSQALDDLEQPLRLLVTQGGGRLLEARMRTPCLAP